MTDKVPKIVSRLLKTNNQDNKIRIRAKKKTDGYSVYLEFFSNGKKQYEYMDKKLSLAGTDAEFENDKAKLIRIVAIRNLREDALLKDETGFSLIKKQKTNFIICYEQLAFKNKATTGRNHKNNIWESSYKIFMRFLSHKNLVLCNANNNNMLDIKKVDTQFCDSYKDFLIKDAGIALTTAKTYFIKLKVVLNKLVDDGIIIKSPAKKIIVDDETDSGKNTKRQYLTIEEVQLLAATPKPNIDTCNAFLFSCFTGLRISDLRALTFAQVANGYIEFKQVKTKQDIKLLLTETAKDIIDTQLALKRSENVFNLMTIATLEKYLKKWAESAGISKHVTCHVARHTFATLSITYGNDIFTTGGMLGQKSIKSTQIYAKLMDKKKDEAISKLPNIKL